MQMAILTGTRHQMSTIGGVEGGEHRRIPIVEISADELVPPFQLARQRIKRQKGIGEQIRTGSYLVGEVGPRIIYRDDE
jgi:hypothetical protein